MVDGFLQMAGHSNPLYRWTGVCLAFAAIFGTSFCAEQNARLLDAPVGKRWPVLFFSHGVGCSRLMYSQICGELASHGYLVVAIEHRDGALQPAGLFAI
jgi:platelet-activating factor acetylhydrolase